MGFRSGGGDKRGKTQHVGRSRHTGSSHHSGTHHHSGTNHHTGSSHHSGTHHHSGAYHRGAYYHSGSSYHSGSITVSGSSPAIYASGSVLVSGSVRGHELYFIHGASNFNTAAQKFLPMGYNDTETAGGTYTSRFVAPCRGRWLRSHVRTTTAGDTSILKLYKAIDGTANPATLTEAVTVEMDAADTTFDFVSISASYGIHFQKGDAIAWRFDPETQPDLTNFTHVLELYTRQDIP